MAKRISKIIGIFIITFVNTIRHMLLIPHGTCKYRPTCSKYAIEAVSTYFLPKAFLKIIIRIFKCNPFSKGGFDPLIKPGDNFCE